MLSVLTQDGAAFEGNTAKRVVSLMRRDNWNAPARKLEYMQEVAERVAQSSGDAVRTDSPAHFLGDLQRAGLLQISVSLSAVPVTLLALAADALNAVVSGGLLTDPDTGKLQALFADALAEAGMNDDAGVAAT